MSKEKGIALAKKEEIDFKVKFAKAELELIRNHIAKDATAQEFALFIYDAQKRGLNPLKKQIYFVKYGGKPSHQTSIDGYRAIAESTGHYDGMSEVKYGDVMHFKGSDVQVPEYAEVTVYRKGTGHGFPARVYFEEFAQVFSGKLSNQWAQRPRHMLAKCAESLALRKAFPEQLSGIYTTDEFSDDEAVVNVRENTIDADAQKPVEAPEVSAPKKVFEEQSFESMGEESAPIQPKF